MSLTLFTATDTAYLPHTKALLASFRHFHPEGACMIYGVELSDADLRELARFGAAFVSPPLTPKIETKMLAACWRFCALLQALSGRHEDVIIACDADAILRGRLDSISGALTTADVAIRVRRRKDPNRKVYAGLLGIRPTPGARLFLQSYQRFLEADEQTWYADQRCLFAAYCELSRSGQAQFVDLIGIEMEKGRRLRDEALAWFPNESKRRSSKFRQASREWQGNFAEIAGSAAV